MRDLFDSIAGLFVVLGMCLALCIAGLVVLLCGHPITGACLVCAGLLLLALIR